MEGCFENAEGFGGRDVELAGEGGGGGVFSPGVTMSSSRTICSHTGRYFFRLIKMPRLS